jgi:putative ABC transport system permease protein
MSLLEMHQVSRSYGQGAAEVRALHDVDLNVEAGMMVAVMGPSGSGKSTLLTIAGSLEDPTSGQVRVCGEDVTTLSRNAKARLRRRTIGYVFQDFNLLPGLTAAENVALPLELDGMPARKARAAGLAAMEQLGLAERASHFPDQLSGGERQRVAIARAVVGDRRLLLADEPSGALDSVNGEAVMRLIHAACKRGLAAVVVTHDAQLASWADRVVFLRDGRVTDQTVPAPGPESRVTGPVPPQPGPVSTGPGSTALRERPAPAGASNGGVPARRAVIRWAWRMFRREWRQQLLVLALIVVALAATVLGAAVATNNPPPAGAGFGTAQDQAVFNDSGSRLASQLAALQPYGPLDVIENQTIAIPGSINTYDLRAQNPHGPFGLPMLSLLSGHYPAGPGQVAVTDGVAATFNLRVGDVWHQGGQTRLVTGLVQNPQSLLDEFALVAPGQVTAPSQVTVLLDARGASVSSLPASVRPYVQSRQAATSSNPLNPETIVLALATIGMLLIALVAVGGFTVLAQRRLRSLGMLGALGAADANIRLVVRINGVLVGLTGALVGAVLGLIGWLAYRPHLESTSHHVIGTFALPWVVIGPSIALAVLATYFAASRPARSITRVPLVAALSGRPAPPKQVHRSAIPGVVLLVVAGALFVYTGKSNGNGGSGALTLVGGFVVLIAAVIMLAPLVLTVLGLSARRAPIAVRLALRDLVRYRARSGSALAAISLGVLIAALICVLVAQRYGNVLDYTGPNLASNQIIVYTPNDNPNGGPHGGGPNGPSTPPVTSTPQSQAATASSIAKALGSDTVIALDQTGASLQHAAAGRSWSGPIYVATPQLLQAFGIKASDVSPDADFLTARPGLSGISKMQLIYGSYLALQGAQGGNGPGAQSSYPCPKTDCLAHPVIQEVGALPSGTSAPNTVITEHAIHLLGLQASLSGWLIQAPHPPTAAQITDARLTAAAAGMTIETKSSTPSSAEILDWATVFGIALALGILAMSVGLIRSETARDLRTLTATGASSSSRRILTATTAFALALGGAVLGTVAAYVAAIGYAFDNSLDGLSELSNVPTTNLLIILVGMPTIAGAVGLLVAGREPPALSHQPD